MRNRIQSISFLIRKWLFLQGTILYDHLMKHIIFIKNKIDEKKIQQVLSFEQLFYQEYILR